MVCSVLYLGSVMSLLFQYIDVYRIACIGLYLTGGLTPKNIDLIRAPDGPFMHAMLDKV